MAEIEAEHAAAIKRKGGKKAAAAQQQQQDGAANGSTEAAGEETQQEGATADQQQQQEGEGKASEAGEAKEKPQVGFETKTPRHGWDSSRPASACSAWAAGRCRCRLAAPCSCMAWVS